MLDASDTHSLALLYHLNSEPSANPESLEEVYEPRVETISGNRECISLPRSRSGSTLQEVIRQRRSCRAFGERPLALADLSEILVGTYGPTRPVALIGGFELQARSVPSRQARSTRWSST